MESVCNHTFAISEALSVGYEDGRDQNAHIGDSILMARSGGLGIVRDSERGFLF